jgi:hypothetical protein
MLPVLSEAPPWLTARTTAPSRSSAASTAQTPIASASSATQPPPRGARRVGTDSRRPGGRLLASGLDGAQRLLVARPFPEQRGGLVERRGQGLPGREARDRCGQESRGEPAGRVAVGDGGAQVAELEGAFRRGGQPRWCRAHHAAAALAVVAGDEARAGRGIERRKTGVAGGAPVVQRAQAEQPAVLGERGLPRALALGQQPAQVGALRDRPRDR